MQEEYDRVVMQAEQRQLVLEKAAAQLHDQMVYLSVYTRASGTMCSLTRTQKLTDRHACMPRAALVCKSNVCVCKQTKTPEDSYLLASGISSQPAAGVGNTFGDEGNRGVDAGGKSGHGAGVGAWMDTALERHDARALTKMISLIAAPVG